MTRFLLNPCGAAASFFYSVGVRGIQSAYRKGLLKVYQLPALTVSVGNLTWGGTGKTPFVIFLARLFEKKNRRVAVLTRGYGQDEALLLTEQLRPIPVLVGADRVASGTRAVEEFQADLLLLDDGYQQWRLRKELEILTVDATAPFGNGRLIPQGTLREPVTAAGRADMIVVTKSNLQANGLKDLESTLRRLNGKAPIFFTQVRPIQLTGWPSADAVPLKTLQGQRVCTLAGIASPRQFEATVESCGATVALTYRVRDHHPYTMGELIKLLSRCQRHGIEHIVTTAKDAVRIPTLLLEVVGPRLKGCQLWVLEITLEFSSDESQFHHRIDSLLDRQGNR